jgi:hypothetical protein
MARTTRSILESLLENINRSIGMDKVPDWVTVDGRNIAAVGKFCFNHDGCGWSLNRYANESGAETNVSPTLTAGEMEQWLRAFHNGMTLRNAADGEKLARLVMDWARTPGDHGGNPHCKEFVRLASRMLGVL